MTLAAKFTKIYGDPTMTELEKLNAQNSLLTSEITKCLDHIREMDQGYHELPRYAEFLHFMLQDRADIRRQIAESF